MKIHTIGFIGTGLMGASMASHLLEKGFEVAVYNRTKAKAEALLASGAVWCDSAAECAAGRDMVISIVGFPRDVEEVWLGDAGILAAARKGSIVCDMTTSPPALTQTLASEAVKRGLRPLDAPVTGGDIGARNGTLSIMVGGDRTAFDDAQEVFSAMGTNINYTGESGSGQHTKMANQIMIAGAMSGVCEALTYAKRAGLDLNVLLKATSTGSAASTQLSSFAPRMIRDDMQPGFYMKHFIKDMKIARDEATAAGLDLKMLDTVLAMYLSLQEKGLDALGTQALIKYYE